MAGKGVVKRKNNFSAKQMTKKPTRYYDGYDGYLDYISNLQATEAEIVLRVLNHTPQTLREINEKLANVQLGLPVIDLLQYLQTVSKAEKCTQSVLITKWKRFTGTKQPEKQRTRADFNNGI